MADTPLERLTRLLRDLNLSWLLPNLRQDFLVWKSLIDPEFYDKFIRLNPPGSEITPAHFSPSRLACIALDQSTSDCNDPRDFIDSIDSQLFQMAMRSFYDETQFQTKDQDLATAGLVALAMVHKYRAINSWNALLDIIHDKPGAHWLTPLACLYGFIEENAGLLAALVQPGASVNRIALAVHIVLSNPIAPHEQLAILMDLCHGPYGDLLPARERLLMIKSLFEQRPQTATDFCNRWVEVLPELSPSADITSDPVGNIDLLAENIFQIEVNKISGKESARRDCLAIENKNINNMSSAIINHYASQLSDYQNDQSFTKELSALHNQMIQSAILERSNENFSLSRAESALILVDQGHIEEAVQLLPPLASPLPDAPYLLYAIARISKATNDHQRACQAVNRIIDLLDHQLTNYTIPVWGDQFSLVNLGRLLLELHKPDEAVRIFNLATQTCPNDASLLNLLAESQESARNGNEAAETLRELVSLYPEEMDYHRALARSLESIAEWEAGLQERSLIIKSCQSLSKTVQKEDIYAYAICGLMAEHPELTMTICADLLAEDQEDTQALIYSGKAYLLMGETDQGMEFLLRATQVSPNESEAWLALAQAQKKIYPLKTVIDTLNNATQSVPDSAQIHHTLGELYLQDNTPTLALPELQLAVALAQDDPQILFTYGQVLKLLGHIDESCDAFSRAYNREPNLPGLAQDYARTLVDLGKLEEAIAPLEMLIGSKSTQDPTPYLDYARCILSLKKHGINKFPPMKALIALNELLQIDPEHAEAKALIAESLAANGDNEMAFQAYREVLDSSLIDDKNWLERLSYGFGCVAGSIGKYDVAIAALQEASQVNPDNPEIAKNLSDAYFAADLPDEAIRSARNVLVIKGEDPDSLSWFASQALKLIRNEKADAANSPTTDSKAVPSEALGALAKAIQLAPTRTDLLVQLGNFQAEIGARTDARDTFASIALMDYAAINDLVSASTYLSYVGDHEAAIACLENAVAQDQKLSDHHEPTLYAQLAEEYVKIKDHISAINTLDKAIYLLPDDGSLVRQKIFILLNQNQSLEALECVETAIRDGAQEKSKINLLFIASMINRAMGDFSTAVKYTQRGVVQNAASASDGSPLIPVEYRSLVADIYRSLLQPEHAYKIIQSCITASETDFTNRHSYLDFIFLHTELALETGEQIRSDFQDLQLETSDPFFPRLMAIKARLMNKAGNYGQADQILQLALKSITNLDQPGGLPIWSATYTKYLTMNSIVEASLDLGLWDQAINGAECVLESSLDEPWSYLNLAKAIALKAEFYNLCQIFEVSTHRPSDGSISKETYDQFSQYIDKLREVLGAYKAEFTFADDELSDDQIFRWQARADIAFKQEDETHSDPCDILAQQHTPGDAAALIFHLQQLDLRNHSNDSVSSIIKIARSYPRHPAVLLQVALAIHDDNPADAMKSLQSVLEQNPTFKVPSIAFCNILLAKIATNLGEIAIAQEAAENPLDIWPDEPGWHTLAAQICKTRSDPSGAINHLSEAIKIAPGYNPFHLELGKVYLENASDDPRLLRQALNSFENALELEPEDLSTLLLFAKTQYLLDDTEKAESNARKALLQAPDRADIYQLLAEVAIRRSDYQGAYEYANQAIQLSPKDIHSGIILAHSLSALGRHNEALAKLNALLPAGEEDNLIHLERVKILRKINGPRAGVDELNSLTSTFPGDFNILNALSKAYIEVGEPENALNVAQQALKARADKTSRNEQANLHLMIGQLLHQSGQLDQSIYHLNEAIQLAPDRLEPYLELGLARKERREYQQALQIFAQATSIAPDDPRAPYQAGLAFKESKDYKSSETMLRRAVSLAPNDLNIRRQLAAVVALNIVHNPRSGRI